MSNVVERLTVIPEVFRHKQGAPRTRDSNGLTPIMKDTLYWLAKGLTYRECANALGMSHGVFRARVLAVYKQLNVDNREDALNRGRELGVIEDV